MGLSASQGRMLLLTARRSDLEFRAQQISQRRLILSQQLEEISSEYEDATSNRQMKISLYLNGDVKNANAESTQKTNLTYATLISGTLNQVSSNDSGIAPYAATEGQEYSASTAYRLVDSDGAIVISDESEIPRSVEKRTKQTAELYDKKYENLYHTGTKRADSEDNAYENESLYLVAKGALNTFVSNKDNVDENGEINADIDLDNKLIRITKDGDEKFYDFSGNAVDAENDKAKQFSSSQTATVVADLSKVPKTTIVSQETSGVEVKKGADGKYTLSSNGKVIARYVVDKGLKYGSTDSSGSNDGPNYLQDALRNGKYLLEKFDKNDKKWTSLSWDSATNIYDSYYTEDDDKAKAKYDREQTQIQNQDKKLELELDNIETQRQAITTEEESVQKVIDDNIEGTFKTFA